MCNLSVCLLTQVLYLNTTLTYFNIFTLCYVVLLLHLISLHIREISYFFISLHFLTLRSYKLLFRFTCLHNLFTNIHVDKLLWNMLTHFADNTLLIFDSNHLNSGLFLVMEYFWTVLFLLLLKQFI